MSCDYGYNDDCDCDCHEDYEPRNFYRELNEIACAIVGHKVRVHCGGPRPEPNMVRLMPMDFMNELLTPNPIRPYEFRQCTRCLGFLGGTMPEYHNGFRDLIDDGSMESFGVSRINTTDSAK